MSIFYKKEKINAPKSLSNGMTFARPVVVGTVDVKQISEEVSHSTTVTRADIMAVIIETCNVIKNHILNSEAVSLSELGTFKPSIRSHGVKEDDKTKFTVQNIVGARIRYQPPKNFVPNGETGPKGHRKGSRVAPMLNGATFKVYGSTTKPATGTTTNP